MSKFVRKLPFFKFRQIFPNFSPPDWNPQKQSRLGQISNKFGVSGAFEGCKGEKGSQFDVAILESALFACCVFRRAGVALIYKGGFAGFGARVEGLRGKRINRLHKAMVVVQTHANGQRNVSSMSKGKRGDKVSEEV